MEPVSFINYCVKVTLGCQIHLCFSTDGLKPVIRPFNYYPGLSFQKFGNRIKEGIEAYRKPYFWQNITKFYIQYVVIKKILNIENKNRTVEASIKVKFGFKNPNISSTVYYAGCISIIILCWSISLIFNFQNLRFAEMNAPFPNKLVFFLATTLIQLWISAIVLFYGYLYPDLRFFLDMNQFLLQEECVD